MHIISLARKHIRTLAFLLIYSLLFYLFTQLFGILLPLAVGALLAAILRPICRKAEQIFHISPGISSGILTLTLAAFLIALLLFILFLIWREAKELQAGFSYFDLSALHPNIRLYVQKTVSALSGSVDIDKIFEMVPSILPSVSGIFRHLLTVPALFLFPVLSFLFCSLFLRKHNELKKTLQLLIGDAAYTKLQAVFRTRSFHSSGLFFSYTIIYMTTFTESVIILLLFHLPYPFLTAIIVTISDVFPILGPGSILLPLCLYQLLCGDFVRAIGLFSGWILITVIRQVIEPRLISKITRTPGTIMLFAFYVTLLTQNLWLIPYTALLFFLLSLLKEADIIKEPSEQSYPVKQ